MRLTTIVAASALAMAHCLPAHAQSSGGLGSSDSGIGELPSGTVIGIALAVVIGGTVAVIASGGDSDSPTTGTR